MDIECNYNRINKFYTIEIIEFSISLLISFIVTWLTKYIYFLLGSAFIVIVLLICIRDKIWFKKHKMLIIHNYSIFNEIYAGLKGSNNPNDGYIFSQDTRSIRNLISVTLASTLFDILLIVVATYV